MTPSRCRRQIRRCLWYLSELTILLEKNRSAAGGWKSISMHWKALGRCICLRTAGRRMGDGAWQRGGKRLRRSGFCREHPSYGAAEWPESLCAFHDASVPFIACGGRRPFPAVRFLFPGWKICGLSGTGTGSFRSRIGYTLGGLRTGPEYIECNTGMLLPGSGTGKHLGFCPDKKRKLWEGQNAASRRAAQME